MRASYVNNSNYLRERAAEMRSSSKELKDNNTAAVIMRWLISTTGSPIAPRPEAIAQCGRTEHSQMNTACQPGL